MVDWEDAVELSVLDIGILEKTGNWKGYYENGKLAFEGTYNEKGEQEGKWIHYHPNGEIYMEGFYLNGEESGEWKKYYDNKQLYTTENYEVNSYNIPVLIGKINTYYKNGKLKTVTEYGNSRGRSTRPINLIKYNLEGIKISEYKLNNKGEFVQIFNNR